MFKQSFDPGWAAIVAALIAAVTAFAFWYWGPDVESLTESKDARIAELISERDAEKENLRIANEARTACLTHKAGLEAQLQAEQENRDLQIEKGLTAFSCKPIVDEHNKERRNWLKLQRELELKLHDATRKREQAERDRDEAEAASRTALENLNVLILRMERNLDLQLSYDSVEKILLSLASETADFTDNTSAERLRGFQLEVIRKLSLVEDFRSKSDDVEFFFNADIQKFYERLLQRQQETDAPLDAETFQRELGELLKNHNSRREDFIEKLELLLIAEKNLVSF